MGLVTIGQPRSALDDTFMAHGATSVIHSASGVTLGCYVDDTTPDFDKWVWELRHLQPRPGVIVVTPPSRRRELTGCVVLCEWFAGWHSPPPAAEGYLLWWDYVPPGETAPSIYQRSRKLMELAARKPRLLWVW
jgi:hypothetical protein